MTQYQTRDPSGPDSPPYRQDRRAARLRVLGADPWSVMTTSFLVSLGLGLCMIVTVVVLWPVLSVITAISPIGTVPRLPLGWTLLVAAHIAVVQVALTTALATLCAFVYNLLADLARGVELTVDEEDQRLPAPPPSAASTRDGAAGRSGAG
nr:DUF3566 domain-containing protein [Streptomyces sp. TP-A0356]